MSPSSRVLRLPDRETLSGEGTLTLSRAKANEFLKQFIENQRGQGRKLEVSGPVSLGSWRIIAECEFDLLAINRSLLKIAFLGTYRFFGDAWLEDPLIPDWHKVLFATDPSKLDRLGLHAHAFNNEPVLVASLFQSLGMHEHALMVLYHPEIGVIVSVIPFANPLFPVIASASMTFEYGLAKLDESCCFTATTSAAL